MSPAPSIERTLAALVDRLVPEDATPGALAAGVVPDLLASAGGRHARAWERVLSDGLVHLDEESATRFETPFADLVAETSRGRCGPTSISSATSTPQGFRAGASSTTTRR